MCEKNTFVNCMSAYKHFCCLPATQGARGLHDPGDRRPRPLPAHEDNGEEGPELLPGNLGQRLSEAK